ncbi:MAG TPA: hypothetical protein VFG10_20755 [Saprospiraceae bacterium]|nr:hypothetical protein [Saprospiraceae bacterium]
MKKFIISCISALLNYLKLNQKSSSFIPNTKTRNRSMAESRTIVRLQKDDDGKIIHVYAESPLFSSKGEKYWYFYNPDFNTLGYSEFGEKEAVEDYKNKLLIFFSYHAKANTLIKTLIGFGWSINENLYISKQRNNYDILPAITNRIVTVYPDAS